MRLNSRTGIEGPPILSKLGLKGAEMPAVRITDESSLLVHVKLSPLVLRPSQEVGSAWSLLSLGGCRWTSNGVFQRNRQS